MKAALVVPQIPSTRYNGFLKDHIGIYRLTAPVLAAYTPEDVELSVYNCIPSAEIDLREAIDEYKKRTIFTTTRPDFISCIECLIY